MLHWGILGTGRIAHIFAEGLAESQTGTLLAVGSRTQAAADAFGDVWRSRAVMEATKISWQTRRFR